MRPATQLERHAFTRGFAIACANLAREHGEDQLAEYLLENAGYKLADLKEAGVESYDLRVLRPLMENITARETSNQVSRETSAPVPSRSGPLAPASEG